MDSAYWLNVIMAIGLPVLKPLVWECSISFIPLVRSQIVQIWGNWSHTTFCWPLECNELFGLHVFLFTMVQMKCLPLKPSQPLIQDKTLRVICQPRKNTRLQHSIKRDTASSFSMGAYSEIWCIHCIWVRSDSPLPCPDCQIFVCLCWQDWWRRYR